MTTETSAHASQKYREAIAANVRAYRARRRLSQKDVCDRMHALGYVGWLRQTVGIIESGKRRITADELVALAQVLDTFPAHLLALD